MLLADYSHPQEGGRELKYRETAGVTMKAGEGWQGETPREPGNQG